MELSKSIFETILYGDLFDYPLTREELWKYIHREKSVSYKTFLKTLKTLPKAIYTQNGYYCLAKRRSLIKKRLEKEKNSEKKQHNAFFVARLLSLIPTVQFVGLSGSVAMKNAEKHDDIDLFIITKKNTIWLTRLFSLLVVSFLGKRRSRSAIKTRNLVCLNFFLDESSLGFSKIRQDIYTAHEIAQVLPLFNRSFTYERFLLSNAWVKHYLPNALGQTKIKGGKIETTKSSFLLSLFEFIARSIQLWYMRPRQRGEFVSDTVLAFHPVDYRKKTMQKFEKRLHLL